MKYLILKVIRAYQVITRSGVATPFFFGGYSGCRSWPTCSEFAYSAIAEEGILHGSLRATKRLLKCHSFSGIAPHHQ